MIAPAKTRLLNIILADDGSPHSIAAAELLADLPHGPETSVKAVRVFTPMDVDDVPKIEQRMDSICAHLVSLGIKVETDIMMGSPAETLIAYADKHEANLVILGAKGAKPALGVPLGSVAVRLVEDGRWPTLIVRAPYRGLKNVLLVSDGSPCSRVATHYLGNFPLPESAKVQVMHVCQPTPLETVYPIFPGEAPMMRPALSEEDENALIAQEEALGKEVLDETAHALAEFGIHAKPALARGDAAHEIIHYARENEIDLIIAGSRGLGTWRGWLLGSVSRELVYKAPCSVLIARCLDPGSAPD